MNEAAARTALRLALYRNGYKPLPISDPNPMLSGGGKAPFFKNWREVALAADEAAIRGWEHQPRNHNNTGLLTGDLVGVDLDEPVAALAERVGEMAERMLGPTPLHRVGKAPKRMRCYRAERPMAKFETPELLLDDGTVMQVEIMGVGQQVVAYGIHPATGAPYAWPNSGPDIVPLCDLPVVAEEELRAFVEAAEIILREEGGRTKKERETDAREEQADPPGEEPAPPSDEPGCGPETSQSFGKGFQDRVLPRGEQAGAGRHRTLVLCPVP